MRKFLFRKSVLISVVCLATINGAAWAQGNPAEASPSAKIFARADWVFNNAELVHYGHRQAAAVRQVRSFSNGRCEANTDCSGFVSYLLSEFPQQYESIRVLQPDRKYPQAKTYTQFFSQLKNNPANGWLSIANISELRRGDFIAWKKPQSQAGAKKSNTGHVAIVIDVRGPIEQAQLNGKEIRYQSVSVIDSSSVKHFQPELLPPLAVMPHRDGVGKGVVRIILDQGNHPIGYWEGTYWYQGNKEISKPTFTDAIAFARLVPAGN